MFGAGILIGPRIGTSLLLGTIAGWALLGPFARSQDWVSDVSDAAIQSYQTGPRGWILWPGVAIMVADALTNLALSWRTILNTFRRPAPGSGASLEADGTDDGPRGMEDMSQRIPNSWWMIGLALGTILVRTVAWKVFGIAPWMTLIAVALSSVLAMIAVRSTGETDINPTGGMGKVTQLVFGGLAPGVTTTNLMAAGISAS
jgi:uncharacterized oligopeptide transporter (OPT) family protein